ncbi:SDR family NAD(P)-dependent oxidoreductase [Mycobacterium sp.]|uniref:SDR family NAD(P)-dependent oxidoreductase n=1 Tax=Mycobacterium sp. TaxID=1785 RepID=UPI003F9A81DF
MSPTSNPRTAIVTGGASGIGAAIAHRLASDGHRVATLDITPAEGGVFYEVDVTDRAQIDTALADIHSRFGPVTILVNAAGAEGFARFLDISFAEWQRVIGWRQPP